MEKKLFVGGLSWGTKEDDLQGAFAKFGEITHVKVITDRETGVRRGFGFVRLQTATMRKQPSTK